MRKKSTFFVTIYGDRSGQIMFRFIGSLSLAFGGRYIRRYYSGSSCHWDPTPRSRLFRTPFKDCAWQPGGQCRRGKFKNGFRDKCNNTVTYWDIDFRRSRPQSEEVSSLFIFYPFWIIALLHFHVINIISDVFLTVMSKHRLEKQLS